MLVHECATITNEQLSLKKIKHPPLVRLDCAVYATYSIIDGIRYVKRLTNSIPEGETYTVLSREAQALHGVYIAEDYRGVRAFKFCPPDAPLSSPGPITNSYWRSLAGLPDTKRMAIESDGVMVRRILIPGQFRCTDIKHYTRWQNPKHPSDVIDLQSLNKGLSHEHREVWMTSFDCNIEGITGYTVVTDGDLMAKIHAHRPGEEAKFYAEIEQSWPCGLFFYMPLDEGEYLTEICLRHGRAVNSGKEFSNCLVFVTNKGRTTLFGAALSSSDVVSYHKMAVLSSKGSQIYVNDWRFPHLDQIRYVAFDDDASAFEQVPIPSFLVPHFPSVCTRNNGPWFTSSCSMEGLNKITLCRDFSLAHKPIIGMLMDYETGHRECLGRFRFDKTLEKLCLDSDTDLYVGTGRNIWRFLYLDQIVDTPRFEKKHLRWMRIPRDGIMEWWNSYQHSILRHTSFRGQVTTNLDDARL
ncbi:hypothetical protein FLONG3_5013 [Fusarium longipes]|uniref:Uncharacterized protein n=1 Tax=Fusarium longipes TaxID=694270 RepID=A0A395SXT9_9HYPO|nr:hypothetical protein FLONG3_5013 [Fusarium longipes]